MAPATLQSHVRLSGVQSSDRELERALVDMAPGYVELVAGLRDELRGTRRGRALFVTGSAAVGEGDRYSDLDLLLVARTGEAESLASALVALVASVAPIVMARWTIAGRLLSTVMADWRRVDLAVIDAESVSSWRAGPALCVFDEIGVGEVPERRYVRSPERLRDRIERFLRSLGLLARDLHRGDLRLLCFAVEFLVDELVTLMFDEIEMPRGAKKGTYRQLPAESLEALDRIPVAHPEPQSVIEAHLAVARVFLPRARALGRRWGVEWPSEMEDATRRHLRRELDIVLP